jgi:hypothetical protein
VFAPDPTLASFRRRAKRYGEGPRPIPPEEQKPDGPVERAARYEDFFDAIDDFKEIAPEEKLTERLRKAMDGDVDEIPIDVDLFYIPDPGGREDVIDDVRTLVSRHDGRMLDEYINESALVMVLRLSASKDLIDALAGFDISERLDLVPTPRISHEDFVAWQDATEIGDVAPPPDGAPVLGIIDSGIRAGNPLLKPAVASAVALDGSFDGAAEDEHGHGTAVAGVMLYGDVPDALSDGPIEPGLFLASVRILDGDGRAPVDVSPLRLIRQAVEYLAKECGCKVINLSVGDTGAPMGARATILAAELDTLARRLDVVLVVCTGNIDHSELVPAAGMLSQWPSYLLDPDFGLLDPAFSASALTVGAVSESSAPAKAGLNVVAVSSDGCPAPFTRTGPGLREAIKPELVASGGNWTVDAQNGDRHRDVGVEIVSTSAAYPNELLCHMAGTSLAAPAIAHLVGRLQSLYPEINSRTLRALVLQAAGHSEQLMELLEGSLNGDRSQLERLTGYGAVSSVNAEASSQQRVVLWAEDSIAPDEFHVYRLPMDEEFTTTSGPHAVTVSLAFDPPVRYRRADYLGFTMDFVVVRGLPRDEVFELAGVGAAELEDKLGKHELKMVPPRTRRSRGANQMARWQSKRAPLRQHHEDWFVVVRSYSRWLEADAGEQPYSLAITLEVPRSEQLHTRLEAQLQAEARIRV